jgi:hypothetical protein
MERGKEVRRLMVKWMMSRERAKGRFPRGRGRRKERKIEKEQKEERKRKDSEKKKKDSMNETFLLS